MFTQKKIDQLVYEVNDSYFKPAGSWTRTYTTYDEKNSRIIEINIVDLEAKTFEDNIYYPFEVIEIFESIESKLWYIHP